MKLKFIREIILIPLTIAGLGLGGQAWAEKPQPSQERKAECKKQATQKGLRSGTERRDFMRQCVHGGTTPPAAAAAKPAEPAKSAKPATPAEPAKPAMAQEPAKVPWKGGTMEHCNKQADEKSLKGSDRKTFMRSCMHPK